MNTSNLNSGRARGNRSARRYRAAGTTAALSLIGSSVTMNAQIYQSPAPDNVFTPVAGTLISLSPSLTGALSIGTHLVNTVTGYASAGLGINNGDGLRL